MNETAATEKALIPKPQTVSLVTKFAHRYSIESNKLLDILKATAFKQRGDLKVTNEQMAALLVVADQYGLNPFTREIFAFPDKQNGIVPVVGVDGWNRIANKQEAFNGMTFNASSKLVQMDADCKDCPEWMEVVIYRKDRDHPIIVREYLDEVYRPAFVGKDDYKSKGPWQTHTKRMLRHKTMIQGQRIAFGFAGIYDEDEAERIIEGEIIEVNDFQSTETRALNQSIKAGVGPAKALGMPVVQSPPDDFDFEQPTQGETPFTLIDVQAKIKTIDGKAKKAKTELQWREVLDLCQESCDMASNLKISQEEHESLTVMLDVYITQAEKALGV